MALEVMLVMPYLLYILHFWSREEVNASFPQLLCPYADLGRAAAFICLPVVPKDTQFLHLHAKLCWELKCDVSIFIHEFDSSTSLLFCIPELISGTSTHWFTISQHVRQR